MSKVSTSNNGSSWNRAGVQRTHEQDTPQYSADAEKAVLASMLAHPETVVDEARATLKRADFFVPAHQEIFETICAMHNGGSAVDITTLHQYLADRKLADIVGSPGILAELAAGLATHLNVGSYVTIVREKALLRETQKVAYDILKDVADGQNNVIEIMSYAESRINSLRANNPYRGAILAARRFDLTNPPPPARPILKLGSSIIATPGNLSVIAAQAKAGKSALIGAIIAASTGLPGDTLGVISANPSNHAVIHFDSEQSPVDHYALVTNALRRVQVTHQPDWLCSYRVADLSPKERFDALEFSLLDAKATYDGVHLVLLDGVADFILDPNDAAESFRAVDRLHRLAVQHNTHLVCVLHFNPGSDFNKTRGHLGSQLERKSETNLALEKGTDGITVIYSKLGRHCQIDKPQGQRFKWDDDAQMHISCLSLKEEKSREMSTRDSDALNYIFAEKSALKYTEIVKAYLTFRGCCKATAERFFSRLRKEGVLKQDAIKEFYVWNK